LPEPKLGTLQIGAPDNVAIIELVEGPTSSSLRATISVT
jgi:hypothetical protein